MRAKPPVAFKTRRDIARYFGGNTIECLICGRRFKRLHTHLAAKHGMAADDYKKRFGLPWTRGLTSATSLANSGWTDERKAKARKLAQKSRFFDLAHSTPRRELAPAQAVAGRGRQVHCLRTPCRCAAITGAGDVHARANLRGQRPARCIQSTGASCCASCSDACRRRGHGPNRTRPGAFSFTRTRLLCRPVLLAGYVGFAYQGASQKAP